MKSMNMFKEYMFQHYLQHIIWILVLHPLLNISFFLITFLYPIIIESLHPRKLTRFFSSNICCRLRKILSLYEKIVSISAGAVILFVPSVSIYKKEWFCIVQTNYTAHSNSDTWDSYLKRMLHPNKFRQHQNTNCVPQIDEDCILWD